MATNKIVVQDKNKNKRIVQRTMIPQGYFYVKDYKEPKKDENKTT